MNNTKKLIKRFYRSIFRSIDHIQKKEFETAFTISKNKKNLCKKIILLDENSNSETKNIALAFGIFFKGLEEFTELFSIISHSAWLSNLKAVERVWFLLQNCNDRFDSILPNLNFPKEVSTFIKNTLTDVDTEIKRKYGEGMYVSPEVKIVKCHCNICNKDPRSCLHIENHVYNGKICRIIPTEIKPGNCIAILPNPKDKRCRIWEIEDNKDSGAVAKNVPFLVSFCIDDFLFEESNGRLVSDFVFTIDYNTLINSKKIQI